MGWFLLSPGDYLLTRWLFLRALAFIYFIAFVSYGVQVTGLIGENGILPARAFLAAVKETLGRRGIYYYPSLAWFHSGDRFLVGICLAGAGLAGALFLGIQTTPILVLLWALYLSLVSVSQVFLSYQWDVLLLETGFLAIFLVPPSIFPREALAPPALPLVFLMRFLAFRLIFMSGVAKIVSGDPTWRNLTALKYHYETQPLPTPSAYFLYRAPLWFHQFSTLFSLAIELVIPFLFFAPLPFRLVAGGLTLLLQLIILITGNFAFFNWLSIVLLIFLYDDTLLRPIFGQIAGLASPAAGVAWGEFFPIILTSLLGVTGLVYLALQLTRRFSLSGRAAVQRFLTPWLEFVATFRLVNPYGLFASMTTRRPEITVEGSDDTQNWLAYQFKFLPGNPHRAPPWVAPHQPRLDWQMWFAALGTYAESPWFLHFIESLITGSPQVLRLLAKNPFPDHPPRYLRAVLYNDTFTTPAEKAETGNWWNREKLGLFLPVVSIQPARGETSHNEKSFHP